MGVKRDYPWLTMGECVDVIVKKYKRDFKQVTEKAVVEKQMTIAACEEVKP
jgi:hypothetical protein